MTTQKCQKCYDVISDISYLPNRCICHILANNLFVSSELRYNYFLYQELKIVEKGKAVIGSHTFLYGLLTKVIFIT